MRPRLHLIAAFLFLAACGKDDLPRGAPVRATSAVPSWAHVSKEQVVAADLLTVPVAFENAIGMRFVLIPAGTFAMGSPASEEGRSGDETQHQVTLTRAYYMSVLETTNAQYRMFKADHDSGFAVRPVRGRSPGISLNGDTQPAVKVSHDDATAFVAWLERRTGERRYRLPTEAEWECACRSGTTTPFAFGTTISANQAVFLGETTLPVGSRSASPWGLYDMQGNALEWCADWYGDYSDLPLTDPTGPSSGSARVVRGGVWANQPSFLRCAHRDAAPPERRDAVGFRLVASRGAP